MQTDRSRWQRFGSPRLLCFAGTALSVVGARLWLMSRYASSLPINDQWDGEGFNLLKPWSNGTLSFADLFAPHNEHRIFFSRLLTLALTCINRQWDSMPTMVFDAILCGALAMLCLGLLRRFFRNRFPFLLTIAVTLWLALPYAHENTLWAFQSSFYFLLLFSLLALWGLLLHPPFAPGWWVGALSALFAPLTMGSGFFAAAIVALVLLVQIILRQRTLREVTPTLVVAVVVVAAGWYFQVTVPAHAVLKAHSFAAWLTFLGRCLAWPLSDNPLVSIVVYAPLVLLALSQFGALRGTQSDPTAFGRLVVAVGLWVLLQAAALAYARGGTGDLIIPSRYLDILGLGIVVNVVALCLLVPPVSKKVPVLVTNLVAGVWLVAMLTMAVFASRDQIRGQFGRKAYLRSAEQAVRVYLATKDPSYLGKESPKVPYPNMTRVAALLNDPGIQTLLPALARLPLHIERKVTSDDTFTKPGCPPEAFVMPAENIWGSYSAAGAAARGSMESETIRTRFPYLQLEVAGGMDGARSLALHQDHRAAPFKWLERYESDESHPAWRPACARVAAPEARLEAGDESTTGWLAFTEPREMGTLSFYSFRIVSQGKALCFWGIGLLIVSGAWSLVVTLKAAFVRSAA
jgi:hypothetical protein